METITIDDKQRALDTLTIALNYTREGCNVKDINLADNGDTAVICFDDGSCKRVNIQLDSAIAAIIEVCKALI